jgi:hypothetical protein
MSVVFTNQYSSAPGIGVSFQWTLLVSSACTASPYIRLSTAQCLNLGDRRLYLIQDGDVAAADAEAPERDPLLFITGTSRRGIADLFRYADLSVLIPQACFSRHLSEMMDRIAKGPEDLKN